MKKVLYIGMTDNIGGIEIYLINLYRRMDKKKYDCYFLVYNDIRPCFYEEIKDKIIYITPRNKNYFKFLKEMKEIYNKYLFDIIHINLVELSFFEPILISNKYFNSKIIIHSHIAKAKIESLKTRILNFIGKKIINNTDNNKYVKVACSKLAGHYMFDDFKNSTFKVLNNGIDFNKFKFDKVDRNKIRDSLNLSEKDILIGNVGRMVPQKNQRYLIELFERILKEDNSFKLLIIGKGPLKNEIINMTFEKNINDKVIFLENINCVNEYMSAMDLFLFPSIYEGLGIVLIEAQANGLKCYSSKDVVPVEADIGNLIYVSLEESLEYWKNIILKDKRLFTNNIRTPYYSKEFDINETANVVMELYKNIL